VAPLYVPSMESRDHTKWQERLLVNSSALLLSHMHQQNSTAAISMYVLRGDEIRKVRCRF
jgi:hypothetical protein